MKKSNDPRHLARRLALQVLFAWTIRNREESAIKTVKDEYSYWDSNRIDEVLGNKKINVPLAVYIIKQVFAHHTQFDSVISKAAPEWPLNQISSVDLSILRMAMAELTRKDKDTPYKVIIDEAVELGKEFGSDSSSKFINGVLGTIVEKVIKTQEH